MSRKVGAIILALLFVPGAAAQQGQPEIAIASFPPTDPIMPETDVGNVTIRVDVGCVPADATGRPTVVRFDRKSHPEGASLSVAPRSVSLSYTATECSVTGFKKTFSSYGRVTVSRQATAFEDLEFFFEVWVEKPAASAAGIETYGPFAGSFVVQPAFVALLQENPATLFVKSAHNKKVVFPVEVMNLGNGPTRVSIQLSGRDLETFQTTNAGADLRLPPRKAADVVPRVVRNLEVMTPLDYNGILSFNATFVGKYDGEPRNGSSSTDRSSIQFSVQVLQAPFEDLPSLGVGTIALAVLAAALSRRRLR